eukprot:gene3137-6173_t
MRRRNKVGRTVRNDIGVRALLSGGIANETPKSPNNQAMPVKSTTMFKTFKRVLAIGQPESWRLYIAFSALAINSATNLSFPWIMGQAIDRASDADLSKFYAFLTGTAGVFLIGSFASWFRIYFLNTSTDRIRSRLRKLLFNSYIQKDMNYFESSNTNELIMTLEKDTEKASEILTDKLATGLRSLNSAINGSILLFRTSSILCLYALGIIPLAGITVMTMSKYSKSIEKKLRVVQTDVYSYASERLNAITTVKLNCKEHYEMKSYEILLDSSYKIAKESAFAQGVFMSFMNLSTNTSLLLVLVVGGRMLARKELTPGELTRFAMQSAFVGLGFSGLASFYSDLSKIFAIVDDNNNTSNNVSSDKITKDTNNVTVNTDKNTNTIMNLKVITHNDDDDEDKSFTITTPTRLNGLITDLNPTLNGQIPPPSPSLSLSLPEPPSGLSIENVSFTYTNRPDTPVLQDLSLHIRERSLVAIVGKSGAGKSTLCKLLCGLLTPTGGRILIGERDISRIDRRSLLQMVGVVEQQSGLLSGTIDFNILYGMVYDDRAPRCSSVKAHGMPSMSDKAVVTAAKGAGLHFFVNSLPKGYHTQVGVGGKQLSGGQQARVAIARALIRGPEILLLDEATAALDADSEREILGTLNQLRREKTIIAFTHSEALVRAADIIFVLEEGKVRASGSYEMLVKTEGLLTSTLDDSNRATTTTTNITTTGLVPLHVPDSGPVVSESDANSTLLLPPSSSLSAPLISDVVCNNNNNHNSNHNNNNNNNHNMSSEHTKKDYSKSMPWKR